MLATCTICEVLTRKLFATKEPPVVHTVGLSFPELLVWKGADISALTKNGAPIRCCFKCLAELANVMLLQKDYSADTNPGEIVLKKP